MSLSKIIKEFKNKDLLFQAFTHRSWVNENKGGNGTNERLEFLGDAILEYIVSDVIFTKLPDKEEGYLTALRANLVNTQNLASVANRLSLGKELKLSKGEEDSGGRQNESLLADTVEALVGAIYTDRGIEAAKGFVEENILIDLDEKLTGPLKDPKSRLQEHVQAKGAPAPVYKVVEASGPDHDKMFEVEVQVEGKTKGSGKGPSKAQAEQKAAENALSKAK